MTVSLV